MQTKKVSKRTPAKSSKLTLKARTKKQSTRKAFSKGKEAIAQAGNGVLNSLTGSMQSVPATIMHPRAVFSLTSAALVVLGLVMVYSSSFVMGISSDGSDASSYFVKQLIALAVGLVVMFAVMHLDYHVWGKKICISIGFVVCVLMLLAVIGLGHSAYGATRWISIGGFQFQPGELVKAYIMVACAVFCYQYKAKESLTKEQFLVRLFAICISLVGLIFLQPDKGTAITLGITIWMMLWVAGLPKGTLLIVLIVGLAAFFTYSMSDSYSRERFLAMVDPQRDPQGSGYQLLHGWEAFGSGGIFGLGLGNSRQKYSYLPFAHNDFILAVVGEEFGLIGCLVEVAFFALLLWSGVRIAQLAPDLFGRLIAYGCTMLIICSFLLNVTGVLGLFPMSGKALPFISYGGSALVGTLLLVGLVLSVSKASSIDTIGEDVLVSTVKTPYKKPQLKAVRGGPESSSRSARKTQEAPASRQARRSSRGRIEQPSSRSRRISSNAARTSKQDHRSSNPYLSNSTKKGRS